MTVERRAQVAGRDLAISPSEMSTRKPLDGRPGALPQITTDGDNVTFHLEMPSVHQCARLVIRCDAEGNVWASIIAGQRSDK